jgi:hypothetical protein
MRSLRIYFGGSATVTEALVETFTNVHAIASQLNERGVLTPRFRRAFAHCRSDGGLSQV